ncbi:ParA family protein [Halorubrum halodurans]|uniref:AAA domain-containing protein n=1 Tax=Halorubrum halodurans TaxID=1383851 RepID=A0A256IK98_9EURY|nr:ParA family protein [Halorubrum halodurans]OYR56971.1 hypothetical protein DJ70_07085 [Halorubrum halodurans]
MMVAVCNQKGGVGKTTVAINVAGALNAAGEDVLLVDLDPQGHATEGLGFDEAYEDYEPTLYTAFTEDESHITEIIRSHKEMDVVPSNLDMPKLENDLLNMRGPAFKLQGILSHVEDDYDHIILDCPPNLGKIVDNAVLASGNVLIPAQAERTSQRALDIMITDLIEQLEKVFEKEFENGVVNEVGYVANKVRTNNSESEKMMKWLNDTFPVPPVWMVLNRVAVQRALDNEVSIFEHDEDLDVEVVFEDIAREIISGDAYAPDTSIAFRNERGSIDQYLDACAGEADGRVETDGGVVSGRHSSHTQETLLNTGDSYE